MWSKGALMLVTSLEHNTTLTTLHLDSNGIESKVGGHIAAALQKNDAVTTITLNGNRLSSHAAAQIMEALEQNKPVKVLTVRPSAQGLYGVLVACTGVDGSDLLRTPLLMRTTETIGELVSALVQELACLRDGSRVRLVLPDGRLLEELSRVDALETLVLDTGR
eukprot:gnl/TRDRNA2_/TRDRNA2_162766_c0_seq1.p1 gnl/TRDRNA2_/TRDRNA2_162766_c0~~gnl/TRDRNA2_/TRDRNA2_162766_c0_seq1.p1  ORF type:complete len:164 (+),score=25.04 gnl/TRDRNA2_/TRDRNA2_162766_c0_seq1:141-632(+)